MGRWLLLVQSRCIGCHFRTFSQMHRAIQGKMRKKLVGLKNAVSLRNRPRLPWEKLAPFFPKSHLNFNVKKSQKIDRQIQEKNPWNKPYYKVYKTLGIIRVLNIMQFRDLEELVFAILAYFHGFRHIRIIFIIIYCNLAIYRGFWPFSPCCHVNSEKSS
jgi:hypothetical protein